MDVSIIVGEYLGDVGGGAIHRRLWIVEGASALAGNAAGLPVVIFIEAANPPVVIYRDIQMNLVAGRTKPRGVRSHGLFQKSAAVGLRRPAHTKTVHPVEDR